jgi:hypothetical protein
LSPADKIYSESGDFMERPNTTRHARWISAGTAAATLFFCVGKLAVGGSAATSVIESGVGKSLQGRLVFPAADPWNKDISKEPLDPDSDRLIASIGLKRPLHPDFGADHDGVPSGIAYVIVGGDAPKVKVDFQYAGESDPGPYPIPPDAPIEGGLKSTGDRHILIIDRDHWKLYELFSSYPPAAGKGWRAGSGAIFDLTKTSDNQRPKGWTSADAAGLPIFPGLVRYDEAAERKEIKHALRFTIVKSRKAYVPPATHFASDKKDSNLPPMGMRVRLKAGYDIARFSPTCQAILKALKIYGMIVADNGSDWFVSGSPDPRWNDDDLHALTKVKGADFEVVKMGEITTK